MPSLVPIAAPFFGILLVSVGSMVVTRPTTRNVLVPTGKVSLRMTPPPDRSTLFVENPAGDVVVTAVADPNITARAVNRGPDPARLDTIKYGMFGDQRIRVAYPAWSLGTGHLNLEVEVPAGWGGDVVVRAAGRTQTHGYFGGAVRTRQPGCADRLDGAHD